MSARAPIAEGNGRGAGLGALGGLLASVPALGPVLAGLCTACAASSAAAGVGIGLARWPFVAAGVMMLFVSGWLTIRRARRCLPPRERVWSVAVTLAVAGATALATYALVSLALVPVARIAARELSDAFAH
ncbi:MAG: hypothetical protein HYU54_06395 [Actinobacteria bacterium]|nr:hypothetical protein [Actinomycetota bacterium]